MSRRAKPSKLEKEKYVGKGGLKLEFAIDHFNVHVENLVAADLGSHQGGFVDCLLQHGAQKVYSVDTCYGTLAWKLRKDTHVIVCERTNALHWRSPEPLDFVTIDVAWTRQKHILPAILPNLKASAQALSLLKPQYEVDFASTENGVLAAEMVEKVVAEIMGWIGNCFEEISFVTSPYPGSGGNQEIWLLLQKPKSWTKS